MTAFALPKPWIVRPLGPHDVDSLLHVQTICYGDDFLESKEAFVQRLGCAHHCSLGVVREGEPALKAYLAAYWSGPGKITPLNGAFTAPAAGPEVVYLHDMSVLPELAGQGVARYLVHVLLQAARTRGVRQAALVSVQGSQTYWERQGFCITPVHDTQQQANLATYGPDAVYMTRSMV